MLDNSGFRRPAALVLVAGAFAFSAACKRHPFEVSRVAYVVGPTQDIVPLDKAVERQLDAGVVGASVLLATRLHNKRVKFCSGTLIAGDGPDGELRILSNHHCFAETDADEKATPKIVPEACTFTKVYFGFVPGRTAQAFVSGCREGSLKTSFEGDLAVFALTVPPPAKYKPLALWEGDDAAAGRKAVIVHYPDVEAKMETPPDGGVRLPTAAATLVDCKVHGLFDVGEWDLDRTLPFSLRHSCDLIHGSSGSGLIDAETGRLLGVNWGGIKITYPDGVRTDNVATRASFVRAFLAGRVEEEVEAAGTRRSSDAVAAARAQSGKDKSDGFADNVRKTACGVVREPGAGKGGPLALALALVLPAVAVLWRRRTAA